MHTTSNRKERRICALLLVMLFLCGCDAYAGKRPSDYRNSVWQCEEENMRIIVDKDGSAYFTAGEDVTTFDTDPEYAVLFDYGNRIQIIRISNQETIMYGECSFSSKQVKVTFGTDNLFDGKYRLKTLSFYRLTESGD